MVYDGEKEENSNSCYMYGGCQCGVCSRGQCICPPQETQETSAPDLQNFHLAEIVVNGKRYIAGEYVRATSNIGILGEQDAMNSPISVTTILKKQLKILCPQLKV